MNVGREHELVQAALEGDPTAFAALVAPTRHRMIAVTGRIVGADDAEDVVQEALIRAFLGLSRLREPERFDAWLMVVAVNVAKMWLRTKLSRTRAVAAATLQRGAPLEERETLDLVRDALELLPASQRDVVLMRYVDDLSCREIAEVLGTTPAAIRVRLHRARTELRRELAPLAPAPFARPRKEVPMVEVTLEDVLVRVAPEDASKIVLEAPAIVQLKEKNGERSMPIFVGLPEGVTLAGPLRKEKLLRPMTVDLMFEVIRTTGGRVDWVAVTSIRENTFYALISVNGEELDARPSDAISLAVRAAAPILVEERLLEDHGLGDLTLVEKAEDAMAKVGRELPAGEWKSLSVELVVAQMPRWEPPPQR